MSRANRGRLTELFVGVRDGYLAAKLGGREVFGSGGLPDYALDDRQPTEKSGEDLFRDFGHLVQHRTH